MNKLVKTENIDIQNVTSTRDVSEKRKRIVLFFLLGLFVLIILLVARGIFQESIYSPRAVAQQALDSVSQGKSSQLKVLLSEKFLESVAIDNWIDGDIAHAQFPAAAKIKDVQSFDSLATVTYSYSSGGKEQEGTLVLVKESLTPLLTDAWKIQEGAPLAVIEVSTSPAAVDISPSNYVLAGIEVKAPKEPKKSQKFALIPGKYSISIESANEFIDTQTTEINENRAQRVNLFWPSTLSSSGISSVSGLIDQKVNECFDSDISLENISKSCNDIEIMFDGEGFRSDASEVDCSVRSIPALQSMNEDGEILTDGLGKFMCTSVGSTRRFFGNDSISSLPVVTGEYEVTYRLRISSKSIDIR
ncbi:MAG: hypothetical protein RR877_03700 [Aurantimicrobium sp.]|uniref:hypothetical protein n=1 Tax=Aurantimicrobium sp. TaxID=1930784 RepID=UPI002FCB6A4C